MSEATLNTLINSTAGVIVAALTVIGIIFGRKPKDKAVEAHASDDDAQKAQPPPGTDPALLTWVQQVVHDQIADALKQRDQAIDRAEKAEDRAEKAERRVAQLEGEIASLTQRVASLETELGRPSDARTRIGDES